MDFQLVYVIPFDLVNVKYILQSHFKCLQCSTLQLLSTGEEVEKLQKELEEMRPLLEQAQVDTEQTMEQIQKDTVVANETKEVVQKEEEAASAKAQETQAIAEDAQRDLDEALPALVMSMSLLEYRLFFSLLPIRTGCCSG